MASLVLPYPAFIDYAVPAHKQCGTRPEELPADLEKYRELMEPSRQG